MTMTDVAPEEARQLSEPVIRTTGGRVRGQREHGLAVFRGIPFAQPPVGPARFAAPRPVTGWDGIRDALSYGPPVPQETSFAGRTGSLPTPTSDDWLTLNVWTADPEARRPVLVWIYGGAYKLGFSGSPGHDLHRIARDGDVVVVSFNYRVGVEGFAHIDGAPANRGLLDQVAALEWVRENIAAFGGDPDLVTVCGESAGAGSIAALLAVPRASGLFHRAILQSMPGVYLSDALAADIGAAIAGEIGLRPTVADLSGVDPWQLPAAGTAVSSAMIDHVDRWGSLAHSITLFAPVVDGAVMTRSPWQALTEGAGRDVELIIGHNRDECRLFIALSGQLGTVDNDLAARTLRAFAPAPDGENAYRTAYPDANPDRLFELVQNDWLFRMPALHLAEAQVAGGGRAHMYELTWRTPGYNGVLGACHGVDGPLLRGTFGDQLGPMLLGTQPPDTVATLATRIRTTWGRFAATGEPGWPTYDPERRLVQIIDDDWPVLPYPEETSRRLWQQHVFDALPLHD
ncbi:carboxylesterase/lipase family protein [Nocardia alni]|uniref:carboxylesterase/lipase family protein n=1 Tax=Nocardia alni TaxID=2815723 RepID=UPI0020B1F3FA|nr:carboxylesterase family protein [Nocardia alni]